MDHRLAMIEKRLNEFEAVEWLAQHGVPLSLRTLREMRARGEIAHYRLKHGRHKILYTEQHLIDAFVGEEIKPSAPSRRAVPEPRRRAAKQRLNRADAADNLLRELTSR